MAYLLDTGILLRAFDRDAADRGAVLKSIRALVLRKETLFVTVQNMAEFWNVTTRPKENNGLGQSADVAAKRLAVIERLARVLTETERSYVEWKRLVSEQSVIGVKVHDARLVAVMLAAGISHMLTLNERDFRRYDGIVAVTPTALPAS